MLSLSPAKLLVVLVVALIVLGPEKLPDMARQVGALWGDLRKWRSRLESEVRGTFPQLPPTHEVVQAVRSPLSFLDRLADAHESTDGAGGLVEATQNGSETDPGSNGAAAPGGSDGRAQIRLEPPAASEIALEPQAVPDDPSMN